MFDILDSVTKIMQQFDQKWDTRFEQSQSAIHADIHELRSELRGRSARTQGPRGSLSLVKDENGATSPHATAEFDETLSSSASDGAANGGPDPQSAAKRMRILENEEENEEPPGKPVQPQPPPFPHDHTTPAGRLLTWPSIRAIVKPLLDAEGIKYIDNYPQRLEESRGQLPLFGRGEGSHARAVERDVTFDYVDMADDVSIGDHPSPSGGTDWGPIGGLSPPGGIPNDLRAQVTRTDGALDFDVQKVWGYVEAYKTHIQNMHPLVPPDDLSALVATFLEEVGAKKQQRNVAKFISQQDAHVQPSLDHERKRKRSPAPNGVESAPPPKRLKPQRSVNHALVLLVLALGKICQWRDRKLPDVPEREFANSGSPLIRNGHVTSPNQGSPPSSLSQSPGMAALASPKDHERTAASRRSSMQAPTSAASPAPPKKNYEIIPGLEYFAYATDILGNQFGSYRLTYIQAHILACLYYGQLGRVIASFRHIRFACQAIIDKLQPSMERLRQFTAVDWSNLETTAPRKLDGITDNKLLIAFWSCCQLESDILAELNLVPSGILQYENLLPYPNLLVMRAQLGFSDAVAYSYAAQLYLRKRLNKISGSLYDPNKMLKASEQRAVLAEIEEDLLNNSHVWLGLYKFDVNDPPAKDILSARIRAKFWGANVITYRPSVKEVLDFSYRRYNDPAEPQMCIPGRTVTGWPGIPEDARTPSDIDPVLYDNARKGVDAIIKSTTAFHGLEDKRFVITNVFGTAHAQWGNLITLVTVYQDPVLGNYVDEHELRELLRKTIDFFEIVSQDSSSLAVDLRVLEGLRASLPTKEELRAKWAMISPRPVDSPAISFIPLNDPTPQSAPGRSPLTPRDMTSNQPTPMG
ncbi:hypothetical protein SLS53_002471 [Cytospora paraplurivora]|uniref:Transcription factor domain-containing protein n=1 Tax=Cytospora paraplurivora TaxID=2898453 RepID=A0AAN9UF20_9PEZI